MDIRLTPTAMIPAIATVLLCHSLHGEPAGTHPSPAVAETQKATPPATPTESDVKQSIESLVGKLNQLVEKNEIATLDTLMTRQGKQDFALPVVQEILDIVISEPEEPEAEAMATIRAAGRKYGLEKIDIKEPDSDLSVDWEAYEKKLFVALGPDQRRVRMLTEILRPFNGSTFSINPFVGKPHAVNIHGESLDVQMVDPGPAAGKDRETGKPDAQVGASDIMVNTWSVLRFAKSADGWLWDGFNLEAQGKLMDERDAHMLQNIQLSGHTASGKDISLEQYRGKFVLIDFWGTWCIPCLAELPLLQQIHDALQKEGFEVIGVAQDDKERLNKFLKKKKLAWENVIDPKGDISSAFGVREYPTTLLIDPKGNNIARNLSALELVDTLVSGLNLKARDYAELRKKIERDEIAIAKKLEAKFAPGGGGQK